MSFGDRTLLLKLALDSGNLESGMRGATSRMSRIGAQLKGFGIALAANVAIQAVDELTDRVGQGVADARAYRRVMETLGQTWAHAGEDADDLAGMVERINAETLSLGFDDVETLTLFQRYLDLTGDAEDANRLLQLSMDRARAEQKDLNTVWSETTRLYRGGVRQVELFGLSVDEYGKDVATGMQRVEAGLGRYEQAAETFAATTDGRLQRVNTAADRLFATLGEELLKLADEWLPIFLDELLPAVAEFWNGVQPILQEVISALAEVWGAILDAEEIWRPVLEFFAFLVGKAAEAWVAAVRTIARFIRWLSGILRGWRNTVANIRERIDNLLDRMVEAWRSAMRSIQGFIDWILAPLQELQRLLQSLNIDPLGAIGDFLGGFGIQPFGASSSGAEVSAASTGGTVVMNVQGDPRTIEAAVHSALKRTATRNGGVRVSNLNQHNVSLR